MALNRILIVDDDRMLRMLIVHQLSPLGYQVDEAENGQDALGRISDTRPDLVVLDGNMPVMDGAETLRRLKSSPVTRDIPVLMLTARRGENAAAEALELGAAGYLAKPFKPGDLVVEIERMATV